MAPLSSIIRDSQSLIGRSTVLVSECRQVSLDKDRYMPFRPCRDEALQPAVSRVINTTATRPFPRGTQPRFGLLRMNRSPLFLDPCAE